MIAWRAALPLALVAAAGCATGEGTARERQLLPGVVVNRSEDTYGVEGATAAELAESIRERGPKVDEHGFGARTRWNVRWRYGYGGLDCRITRLEIDLEISVLMPEWNPPENAPADLVERWSAFVEALDRHERVHGDNAIEAARRVRDALRETRASSCFEMEREANAAARRVVARYHQRDIDYDAETDHGRTEGAILDDAHDR